MRCHRFVVVLFLAFVQAVVAQDGVATDSIDARYLEDQFYAGLSYNFLLDRPGSVIQRNLSYNLQLGFLKDIPLNKNRNFGLALGVGYATNSYYSSLLATETEGVITYQVPEGLEVDFNRSKIETHAVEFPFELRWRTSNATDYKFWRVYGGIKASYLFSRTSKIVSDQSRSSFQNDDIRAWQYGVMMNFGYNTWNVHIYYALAGLFEDGILLGDEAIDMRPLRIGVIFYIL
ncbi:MAG: PorT family protein [Flavobacteriaceae bacterium]|nr:PorT family protein [Flavobacteriaceae bacterium]